jgi:VCBS repeat-containing protein
VRTKSVLRVSTILGLAAIAAVSLAPADAWARTRHHPRALSWDNADVTRDGVVDRKDIAFVARLLGHRCSPRRPVLPADLNHDCRVDGLDLKHVIREAWKARKTRTNAPPQPQADTASTQEDTPVTIAVLANDGDPNGDMLQVTSATAGGRGATTVNPDGTIVYQPAPDAHGTDTFSYTVADAGGLTATQTVTVAIAPVNDAPAVTASASVSSGTAPLDVTLSAQGTDADGDQLTYSWSFGDAQSAAGAQVSHVYRNAGEFDAMVTISDGQAAASASVRVSVARAPVARPDAYRVDTVAGTGAAGSRGEGGSAVAAQLGDPRQVVRTPDGSFYVADALRLVRVDAGGTLTRVRTFTDSGAGDEGVAIAVGPDGAVYYTDADILGYCSESGQYAEVRVRRLGSAPAEDAVVATWVNPSLLGACSPSLKLAIDGAGSFYLAAASVVVKLEAGAAEPTWVLDVADQAYSLAGDPAGGVYVGGFSGILRIDAAGGATAFAGTGSHGSTGDGGPALAALVGTVAGLAVCPDGTVTFLEFDLTRFVPRIREVTRDGAIATIGGGTSGFNGDGREARATAFGFTLSAGVASLPDGGFLVTDRNNVRVRRLLPATTP